MKLSVDSDRGTKQRKLVSICIYIWLFWQLNSSAEVAEKQCNIILGMFDAASNWTTSNWIQCWSSLRVKLFTHTLLMCVNKCQRRSPHPSRRILITGKWMSIHLAVHSPQENPGLECHACLEESKDDINTHRILTYFMILFLQQHCTSSLPLPAIDKDNKFSANR